MLDLEPTGADGAPSASAPTSTTTTSAATTPAKKTATKAVKKTTKKAPAKKTAAKKATKKAATPAEAEQASADSAATDASPASATTKKAAKKTTTKAAAKKTTAKKATKKATAKKATADQGAEPSAVTDAPEADGTPSSPARKRASRKAAAPPAALFDGPAQDSAVETGVEAVPAGPVIPTVLFQPPVAEPAPRRSRKKATPPPVESGIDAEAAASADDDEAENAAPADDADADREGGPRRRRRRGGRGRRGRGGEGDEARDDAEVAAGGDTSGGEASDESADESSDEGAGSGTSRRRRSRRRGEGAERSERSERSTSDDSGRGTSRSRSGRSDEPTAIKGSVRIEAKRQRRREGREAGRRRPPVLTEAEFLARRESVDRVMVVRQVADRTQIAVLEDGVLVEHHVSRETTGSMIGNVYLGRVQNVLPSMEAAFIDIGRGRNAVLYAGEVNWDAAGLDGQPKRIEVALKSGDAVLVQVTKDPVGHKGARLTSQISLPGRYLVFVPDGSMTGISRKLPDTERSRLKSILKRVLPEGAGVIVRTASEGASEEELSRDVSRLSAQWEDIQEKAKTASPASLLYGEPDLTIRVIRDIFNEDFNKVVVSGAEAWDTVDAYVGHVAPDLHDRIERWTSDRDVWSEFRIDEQLMKALDRKVWLPSGGSLVIDRTEAMTVVDVNTGKFTGQGGNLEQTVTENNLEAAEEIVRQLRLRDIGGIIVIDFIDMVLESNRELVLRRLLECLGRDRTKHQVAEVTSLGLVQMTRKRVGQGLLEVFSTNCESCNGRGLHVHMEPVDDRKRSSNDDSSRGRDDRGKGNKSGDDASGRDRSTRGKSGKGKTKDVAEGNADAVDAADEAPAGDGPAADESSVPVEAAGDGRRGRRSRGRRSSSSETTDAGSESGSAAAVSAPETPRAVPVLAPEPTPAPRTAPVLAPRGVDLAPPAETAAPKRRRRAASRPAGAPEGGSSPS